MDYKIGDYILYDMTRAQVKETTYHCFQGSPIAEQRIRIVYDDWVEKGEKMMQWVPASVVKLDKKRMRIIKINKLLNEQ